MNRDFVVEPLGRNHQRQNFDCGEESLNLFLRNFARQNSEKGLGKTFVAVSPGDTQIFGYYTLSSGSVSFETVPEKVPRYPIPTVHLGRLAVANAAKGKGLGEFLLMDALSRSLQVSEELGIYAIDVFALNNTAKNFYSKYGFIELKDNPYHLYLPIATLKKSGF